MSFFHIDINFQIPIIESNSIPLPCSLENFSSSLSFSLSGSLPEAFLNNSSLPFRFAISKDVGFRMNPHTGEYELVADLETWNQPIPVERFMDKVNQQYARMTIHNTVKKQGFQVAEEWEMEDNTIELTVTRWV